MKRRMLSILCGTLALALLVCLSSPVQATSVWTKDFDSESEADTFWTDLEDDYGASILEDFEKSKRTDDPMPNQYGDYSDGTNTFDSSVNSSLDATWTAVKNETNPGANQGTGLMSFENDDDPDNYSDGVEPSDDPEIGIIDVEGSEDDYQGRIKKWDSSDFFGTRYLDSGDVKEVALNDELGSKEYRTLSFFLFDVGDVGGTMTIQENGDGDTLTYTIPDDQGNGNIKFFNVYASAGNYLTEITWKMNKNDDGWGIDNVGTGAPVPEPSTMLLLGSGLLGVAALGRKKFMKRS